MTTPDPHPDVRPPGMLSRAGMRFASSKVGTWIFLNVFAPIDRRLLSATRGRLSVSVGQPVLLLHSTGARSGEPRKTALAYLADADRIVLIASNGGGTKHPAWYHNLCKHSAVRCTLAGKTAAYRARQAVGEEREALWKKAVAFYPGYAVYEERATERRIPVMVLERDSP